MDILTSNWSEIVLAILTAAGTVTALTETEKDDKVINILKRIVQAIVLGKSRGKKKWKIRLLRR